MDFSQVPVFQDPVPESHMDDSSPQPQQQLNYSLPEIDRTQSPHRIEFSEFTNSNDSATRYRGDKFNSSHSSRGDLERHNNFSREFPRNQNFRNGDKRSINEYDRRGSKDYDPRETYENDRRGNNEYRRETNEHERGNNDYDRRGNSEYRRETNEHGRGNNENDRRGNNEYRRETGDQSRHHYRNHNSFHNNNYNPRREFDKDGGGGMDNWQDPATLQHFKHDANSNRPGSNIPFEKKNSKYAPQSRNNSETENNDPTKKLPERKPEPERAWVKREDFVPVKKPIPPPPRPEAFVDTKESSEIQKAFQAGKTISILKHGPNSADFKKDIGQDIPHEVLTPVWKKPDRQTRTIEGIEAIMSQIKKIKTENIEKNVSPTLSNPSEHETTKIETDKMKTATKSDVPIPPVDVERTESKTEQDADTIKTPVVRKNSTTNATNQSFPNNEKVNGPRNDNREFRRFDDKQRGGYKQKNERRAFSDRRSEKGEDKWTKTSRSENTPPNDEKSLEKTQESKKKQPQRHQSDITPVSNLDKNIAVKASPLIQHDEPPARPNSRYGVHAVKDLIEPVTINIPKEVDRTKKMNFFAMDDSDEPPAPQQPVAEAIKSEEPTVLSEPLISKPPESQTATPIPTSNSTKSVSEPSKPTTTKSPTREIQTEISKPETETQKQQPHPHQQQRPGFITQTSGMVRVQVHYNPHQMPPIPLYSAPGLWQYGKDPHGPNPPPYHSRQPPPPPPHFNSHMYPIPHGSPRPMIGVLPIPVSEMYQGQHMYPAPMGMPPPHPPQNQLHMEAFSNNPVNGWTKPGAFIHGNMPTKPDQHGIPQQQQRGGMGYGDGKSGTNNTSGGVQKAITRPNPIGPFKSLLTTGVTGVIKSGPGTRNSVDAGGDDTKENVGEGGVKKEVEGNADVTQGDDTVKDKIEQDVGESNPKDKESTLNVNETTQPHKHEFPNRTPSFRGRGRGGFNRGNYGNAPHGPSTRGSYGGYSQRGGYQNYRGGYSTNYQRNFRPAYNNYNNLRKPHEQSVSATGSETVVKNEKLEGGEDKNITISDEKKTVESTEIQTQQEQSEPVEKVIQDSTTASHTETKSPNINAPPLHTNSHPNPHYKMTRGGKPYKYSERPINRHRSNPTNRLKIIYNKNTPEGSKTTTTTTSITPNNLSVTYTKQTDSLENKQE
ncbi:hypothetical protein HK098_002639 [Nowakowskiella sp. JEL0407]|nr:hypothetical protein HK098_002639 [Nowakowskiella sp. JEL0407]